MQFVSVASGPRTTVAANMPLTTRFHDSLIHPTANLGNEDTIQLMLPFDDHSPGALDATLDRLRDPFEGSSVTRATLLGP